MQFLLFMARRGDGINGLMSQVQAVRLERLFRRLTPESALRIFRFRRALGPVRNPFPKTLRRLLPVYG